MQNHKEGRVIVPRGGQGHTITPIWWTLHRLPAHVALWSPDTDLDLGENEGEEREMREKKKERWIIQYALRFYGLGMGIMDTDVWLWWSVDGYRFTIADGFYSYMIVQLRANAVSARTKYNGCWIITKLHIALPLAQRYNMQINKNRI